MEQDARSLAASLIRSGCTPAEAQKTVETFINPTAGRLVLDAAFFAGRKGTLPREEIRRLCALSPAGEITLSDAPSPAAAFFVEAFNEVRNLRGLTLKNVRIEKDGLKALNAILESKPLEKLHLEQTDIASDFFTFPSFCRSLQKCRTITNLTICDNRGMFATQTEKFMDAAKRLPLKSLDVSGQMYSLATFAHLPETLENLAVRNMPFTAFPPSGLLGSLENMPHLKSIDARGCHLFSAHFEKLCRMLPDTKIERLDLFGLKSEQRKKINDNDVAPLITALKAKGCPLVHTGLTKSFDHDLSPETVGEIALYETDNADIKANSFAMQKKYAQGHTDLFTLAGAGRIKEALAAAPLPFEAYKQTDGAGKTLIARIAEAGDLAVVLRPERIKTAKEMGELWAMVPDRHKAQMDGKDGRPSFTKIKQAMMIETIKSATAKNAKNR